MKINNLFSIKNKVIIITGGGKGIGNYLAVEMGKNNSYVYCIDKKFSKNSSHEMLPNVFQIKCDITDNKKFRKVCDKIFIKHKKIDVLINNAGITFQNKNLKFYSLKKWNDTIMVNLTAAFTCSQIVIDYMIKNKKGSIINITSLNAELAFPKNPAYVASKGGLKMLGKSLARDWGTYGIRVNNLGPGYIKTDMVMNSYLNKKFRKVRESQTMLGKWGEVEDLVGPCIFLASDASKFITGQDIYVDGGWTANGLPLE